MVDDEREDAVCVVFFQGGAGHMGFSQVAFQGRRRENGSEDLRGVITENRDVAKGVGGGDAKDAISGGNKFLAIGGD
jgi:hypothetical protein